MQLIAIVFVYQPSYTIHPIVRIAQTAQKPERERMIEKRK